MYISKKWLDHHFLSNGFTIKQYEDAFDKLGWKIVDKYDQTSMFNNLFIGKIGNVSKIDNSDDSFVFVDLGDELVDPFVSNYKNWIDGGFVLVAKDKAVLPTGEIVKNQIIDNRASVGKILSLKDLNFKNLTELEKENVFNIFSHEYLVEKIGLPNGVSELWLDDLIWNLAIPHNRDDLTIGFNVLKTIAKVLEEKNGIDLKNLRAKQLVNNHSVGLKLRNTAITGLDLLGYNFVEAKSYVVYDDSDLNLNLFSKQEILLRYLNFKIEDNIFANLSNLIFYETGVKTVFIDEDFLQNGVNISTTSEEIIISKHNEDVVFSSIDGYNSNYKPSHRTKNYVVIYYVQATTKNKNYKKYEAVKQNSDLINQAFERVVFWLDHYGILATTNKPEIMVNNLFKIELKTSSAKLNDKFGKYLKAKDLNNLLSDLGFDFNQNSEEIDVKISEYRQDIKTEKDLINEIRDWLSLKNKKN
ncbi:hypothetical protein [Spiroplasma endosymbiont of Labia minor]|uniref:hypothetical protein n=1 Tax=Spiroplasma endosymbiont of Labia minor TaxID=3066305 RepID=UPI0030D4AD8A